MKIGLIDVDGGTFPNYALMKISAWHKRQGNTVEWAQPLFQDYDFVYKSKVFNFTEDNRDIYHCPVYKGGTGYDIHSKLPQIIDDIEPDYSIYNIRGLSYGFLTRGCCNHCPWCVVPIKEGKVEPYRDVEDVAQGNKKLILMDNNILASDYGIHQLEKIRDKGYRVDFNQGLDARKIDEPIAKILGAIHWIPYIRLACDKAAQIPHIMRAYKLLRKHGYHGQIFVYFLISDWDDALERIAALRPMMKVLAPWGQPYRDFNNPEQVIPKWQKDMARWMNRKAFYKSMDFKDFEPRKNFKCEKYFNELNR